MKLAILPYLALLFPPLVFSQDSLSFTDSVTTTLSAALTLGAEHSLDQSPDTTAPTSTPSPQIFLPSFNIIQPNANTIWNYPETVVLSWDTSNFSKGILLGGIKLVLANNSEHLGPEQVVTVLEPLGFDLSVGNTTIPVPNFETGNYVVAITAELYQPVQSAVFLLNNPKWTAPNETYASANASNNANTTSIQPSPTVTTSESSSNSGSSSVGVIAGGVVGGIAGAAIVVAIMYVFRWKISSFLGLGAAATKKNEDFQLQDQKPKNWKYGNLDDSGDGVIPDESHA